MLQLIAGEKIDKVSALGNYYGANSKTVNNPHQINEVNVVGIGNDYTCCGKNDQADQA